MSRKTEVGIPPCECHGGCQRAPMCKKYREDCWAFRFYIREGVHAEKWLGVMLKRQTEIKPLIDNPAD